MVLLKPSGLIAVAFSDVNKKKLASDKIVDLGTGAHLHIDAVKRNNPIMKNCV